MVKEPVTKRRRKDKHILKDPPSYLINILPFVVSVQDYQCYPPEELIKLVSTCTSESKLDSKAKEMMNEYLIKYGYKPYW